jgi:uncharacterized protein (TIGR04255 family)
MAEISDRLRTQGFPEDVSVTMQRVVFTPTGPQAQHTKIDEFRSKDHRWSLVIGEDACALLTSGYTTFAEFAEKLRKCLEIIDAVAGLQHGQIHRIGIRYVDVIEPGPAESFRDYLQPSLHGPKSSVMQDSIQQLHLESVGKTALGTMIIRMTQNDQGLVIPPDITMNSPLAYKMSPQIGAMITLLDSDHFSEALFDYDLERILNSADALHQAINAAWFNDIITPHALKKWEAQHVSP